MDANLDKNVENTVEKPEKVSAEIGELRDRLSKIEKLLGIIARCELASVALNTKNEQLYSDDVERAVSSLLKDANEI
jgi:hypothetical protein